MRRNGVTLIESLVALFVAALGMVALLTLFPLGALQMGQALKDARCGQAAQEADGLLRWYWSKYETSTTLGSPIQLALDQGDYPATVTPPPPALPYSPFWLSPTNTGPSYPVLVDPLGTATTWPTSPTSLVSRVAGLQNIPRRTTQTLPTTATANILRFCMLQDDISYDPAGTAAPVAPSSTVPHPVERGARYTWAWMLQRQDNSKRGIISVNVIVFDQRPPFSANPINAPVQTEQSYTGVNFSPGNTGVTMSYTGTKPAIIKGRWIMDASLTDGAPTPSQLRHANFYRVASVNDDTPGYLYIELETPVTRSDGSTNAYQGTLVVLNGVAEVFQRNVLVTGQ